MTLKRQYRALEDNRTTDVVPCGKCHECLANRRNSWAFRLYHQNRCANTSAFITLTYETEPKSFNGHGTLDKTHLQKFIKRLRKANLRHSSAKIKYYAVGEYGSQFKRPHYHLIIFNVHESIIYNSIKMSKDIWQYGIVDIAAFNMATVNYVVGYVMKSKWQPEQDDDDRLPEFSTMSKNLGISYLSDQTWDYHVDGLIGYVRLYNGAIMNMPRYFKDKIFSRDERQELRQEAELLRKMDWNEFVNYDFDMECQRKDNAIKKHIKKQNLQRLKL